MTFRSLGVYFFFWLFRSKRPFTHLKAFQPPLPFDSQLINPHFDSRDWRKYSKSCRRKSFVFPDKQWIVKICSRHSMEMAFCNCNITQQATGKNISINFLFGQQKNILLQILLKVMHMIQWKNNRGPVKPIQLVSDNIAQCMNAD